jgi:hypothetical protein
MKIQKLRYCPLCKSRLEPNVEIISEVVRQKCSACGEILGEAGAFAMNSDSVGERLRVLVRADDILIGE